MPPTIEPTLRARVDAFVADLSELIHAAALEAVQEALGGIAAPARRRGPGRPRKKAKRGTGRPRKATGRKRAGKRIRRTAADLEATAADIHAHVKANPGPSMTEMSNALGMAAKDLRGPLRVLLEDKKLRTEGEKRGTKYFAGGGGKKKKTKKKAAAKKKGKKAKRKGSKRVPLTETLTASQL